MESQNRTAEFIAIAAAIATVVSVGINFLMWREARNSSHEAEAASELSKEALFSSRRAWIVPLGAQVLGNVAAGQALEIEVAYENVGNEPATIASTYQPVQLTTFSDNLGERMSSPGFPNNTCQSAGTGDGGLIVYPKQAKKYTNRSTIPAGAWSDDVFSGAKVMYVLGCITYETLASIRHSAYCFYLRPEPGREIAEWKFYACGTGIFVD